MIELFELMEKYQNETLKFIHQNAKFVEYNRYGNSFFYKGKGFNTEGLCPFYSDTIKQLLN